MVSRDTVVETLSCFVCVLEYIIILGAPFLQYGWRCSSPHEPCMCYADCICFCNPCCLVQSFAPEIWLNIFQSLGQVPLPATVCFSRKCTVLLQLPVALLATLTRSEGQHHMSVSMALRVTDILPAGHIVLYTSTQYMRMHSAPFLW